MGCRSSGFSGGTTVEIFGVWSDAFASKSSRRTAAPTLECISNVGAGLLAKRPPARAQYSCRHTPLQPGTDPAPRARANLHRESGWCC
ncbi:hypothetical protein C1X65_13100 [Pseudomonas sp. FW305-70]|nr:hypothetical protein C1X65_13100 [Pseudomonas sp. FW305-70]